MRVYVVIIICFALSIMVSNCVDQPCNDNNACLPRLYCNKDMGNCEGNGVCAEKPECCIEIYSPVCGCDGCTYSNECYAAMSGMNVDYSGECTSNCTDNDDCPDESSYCKKHMGYCEGRGICTEKPDVCPEYYSPVCGCDGTTYSNPCHAAASGVNVLHMGECI